jgi:NitT/TauT family transport system substrate-binding protein
MTARVTRSVAAIAAAALAYACSGSAASGPPTVTLALPASTLVFSTAFIAQDLGLFARENLDVRLKAISGVGAVNAVLAGEADFTVGSGPTFLRAIARGQRLLAIANLIDRPLVELVVRRDRLPVMNEHATLASRGQSLKGMTIASQGMGSITHAWIRYVASDGGLDPERDVRVTPLDPPAMVTALAAGLIDGFATSPPFTTQSVRSGVAVSLARGAIDAPELQPFGYALLYGRPETCVQRKEVCARMVRAFAAASRAIAETPDVVFEKVLVPRFAGVDRALLHAAWTDIRGAHVSDVRVTDTQLDHSQQLSLRAKLLAPGEAVDRFGALFTHEFIP